MFIDPTTPLAQLDGTALYDGTPDKPLVLSSVICTALLGTHEKDANASGEEKFKWFQLATKVHGQTMPVEVTVEDASLIKKRVAMFYGALVVGLVFQAIEAAGKPVDKQKRNGKHAEGEHVRP